MILTRKALNDQMARHRRDLAAQLIDTIRALTPAGCSHNHRKSCPVCARRQAIADVVSQICEACGLPQQQGGGDE